MRKCGNFERNVARSSAAKCCDVIVVAPSRCNIIDSGGEQEEEQSAAEETRRSNFSRRRSCVRDEWSPRIFGKFLATGGELLLINRVSSAVRDIHYLAPAAAHLFRRPIYLSSAPSRPRILTRVRERGINQRFLETRPAAGAHFIPLTPPSRNCDRRNLSPDSFLLSFALSPSFSFSPTSSRSRVLVSYNSPPLVPV